VLPSTVFFVDDDDSLTSVSVWQRRRLLVVNVVHGWRRRYSSPSLTGSESLLFGFITVFTFPDFVPSSSTLTDGNTILG